MSQPPLEPSVEDGERQPLNEGKRSTRRSVVDSFGSARLSRVEGIASARSSFRVAQDAGLVDRREAQGNATNLETFVNFLTSTVGVGVCSLPAAFATGGWMPGFFLLGLALGMSLLACLFVCWSADLAAAAGVEADSFEEIAFAAFGSRASLLTGGVAVVDLTATCVILLVLLGDAGGQLHLGLGQGACMVLFAFLVWPISLLKDMSSIAKVAVLGVGAICLFLVTVILAACWGEADGGGSVGTAVETNFALLGVDNLAGAAATFAFCFACAILVPTMKKDMATPSALPRVICASHAAIGVVYALVAGLGYHMAGKAVAGNVILSMSPEVLRTVASAAVVLNCVVSYPLFMNPVCVTFERVTGIGAMPPQRELTFRVAFRSALVAFTLLVAYSVPYFKQVVDITGALTVTLMCSVLPGAFFWKLTQKATKAGREAEEMQTGMKVAIGFVVIYGACFVLPLGLFFGIQDLVAVIAGEGA